MHDAALVYLSRYAATRAGLLRVLERRIAKWKASEAGDQDRAGEARETARAVVARLAASGAVNDAAFAQARTRTLQRAGKSNRAISAHLSSKGVRGDPDASGREGGPPEGGPPEGGPPEGGPREGGPPDELGAAAIHIRRRRLGPFRTRTETSETRMKELATLARAGFPHGIAAAALRLSLAEAEALIVRYREGIG